MKIGIIIETHKKIVNTSYPPLNRLPVN